MKKTVSVAPMMDCTDKHEIYFLSLISKNIHLYSEMIVANAIIRGDRDKLLSFKKIFLWKYFQFLYLQKYDSEPYKIDQN